MPDIAVKSGPAARVYGLLVFEPYYQWWSCAKQEPTSLFGARMSWTCDRKGKPVSGPCETV
jgi:hypothetical protein